MDRVEVRGPRGTAAGLRLTLRELEPLAGARTSGLLPLDGARVAGQEGRAAELGAVHAIGLDQRPGDAELQGAGPAGRLAAGGGRRDVARAEGGGGLEGPLDVAHERRRREVTPEGAPVHVPLAGARRQVHASRGGLAAAGGLRAVFGLA